MEFQSCRNILLEVENMGFKVTWKFIDIGVYGNEWISSQMSHDELFEYFDIILEREMEKIDDIITLFCVREDDNAVDNVLRDLAEREAQNMSIELRKWRAYLLKKILDNANQDCLQGLLELMEFWLPMKDETNCPHVFPQNSDKGVSTQQYFTKSMYKFLLQKNRNWLEEEIDNIINDESIIE